MMVIVIGLWVLAMVAALSWAGWVVGVFTGFAVAAFLILQSSILRGPVEWIGLLACGAAPLLLAGERRRYEKLLRRLQATEAARLNRLKETGRLLLDIQSANQKQESDIAQITNLYQVIKETARALRVDELFASSLEIIPRLLDVQGLRLVDLSGSTDGPCVFRARRACDGRLLPQGANHLTSLEEAVLNRAMQSSAAGVADAADIPEEQACGVSRMAWAPLWTEQKPIGVLMADDLPQEQLGTLSIVTNQLSLQLARVHFYQQVESMAVSDSLTGLFVRRYFMELAGEELLRSKRHSLPCAFLMADLDFFKSKNDAYGHLVGDVVLREVAQLMHGNLRGIDLMARYGGEEFILLLTETQPQQAASIAERFRQLVEAQPIRAYDETLSQTVSIGIACFPEDGEDLGGLVDRTDQALYAAKRAGRNRIIRWSPNLRRV